MKATFIELSTFQKYRADYLDDDQYRSFQQMLMENPEKGALIQDTGGLRKVRFRDARRNKGTRGGSGLSTTGPRRTGHLSCLRCTKKTRATL